MINFQLMLNEAERLGIKLNEYALDRFDNYAERLVRWNEFVNLTAITDPDEIVIKHFIDSITILKYVDLKADDKLIDVGTGAGFPGLPLLIAKPKIDITFVDSIKKKLTFIKEILNNNGLTGIVYHERVEELGKIKEHREAYDYATARAVAPLNVLCEYCLPLVKVGGMFISLKGSNVKEEIEKSRKAISTLGGELVSCEEFELPNGDPRSIVFIKKVSHTPTKYPRRSKKIDTKPL